MRNSSQTAFLLLLLLGARAHAQQPAQGFAVDRMYPSAPGAGWFVMDNLDMHGGIGGAASLTLGYSANPLRVTDGVNRLAIVSSQAMGDVGAAVTYRRWRFYLNLDLPIVTTGDSGMVGAYAFTAPSVNFGSNPDAVADVRFGTDVRVVGRPGGPFRFGAGAQLLVPNGNRGDYDSDGSFRAMTRVLVAGDARSFTYAAHLGVHIRPLDDSPVPGSPKGSELLFGLAAGARLPLGHHGNWTAVVGPEMYAATAFRAFLESNGTALEGLLTARIEGTGDNKALARIKLGVGGGLNHHFGAAEWRLVLGIELFGQHVPASSPR